jgi:hypothetical protein
MTMQVLVVSSLDLINTARKYHLYQATANYAALTSTAIVNPGPDTTKAIYITH